MKLRPLIITVAILVLLSGLVYWVNLPQVATLADPRIGQPLLASAPAESTAKLSLTDTGKTVVITKGADGTWLVNSYYDFPADFDKLAHFIDDLTSAKVDSFVSSAPSTLARLDFKDTKVVLQDASGKSLLDLSLGKTDDTGGRFLHYGTEGTAFKTHADLTLDPESKNWADSALVKLKAEDIAKIELSFPAVAAIIIPAPAPPAPPAAAGAGDPNAALSASLDAALAAAKGPTVIPGSDATTITATRAKKEDPFAVEHSPAGQQFKPAALNAALGSLTDLRFTDTTATDDANAIAAKAHERTITLTTFDGKVLTIALGRKPEEQKPKASAAKPEDKPADGKGTPDQPAKPADTTPPADPTKPATPAEPEMETVPAGPVFVVITNSDPKAPINTLMGKRAFEVSDFALTSLPQKLDDLFEPIPAPPTPAPAATTGLPNTLPMVLPSAPTAPATATTPPITAPAPAAPPAP